MPVPQVVIVGRPNVGKSSLLNWLAGRKISIVDDVAGVTRDRVTYLMDENGRFFDLVDTGGIGIVDCDNLTKEINEQIEVAIESADVVLFVVDTRTGIAPLDEEVAKRLRYVDKPIICVANKSDHDNLDPEADAFYKLGRKVVRISVHQNRNKDDLMQAILERLPAQTIDIDGSTEEPTMKIAIVGRRNTGKSTFVNTLAQAERMIVSEVPGTTRDSVDVRFELDGKTFMAIDTPGLKRSRSVRTDIDFYSFHRAQRSIRRADVVLMFFDCSQRMSKVDKQLVKYIADNYRPCIFVVNKWDKLVGQMPTERWVDYLRDNFTSMWHVPIAFITGQTGKNVKALLNHAQMLFKQSRDRVSTSELNKLVRAAVEKHPPPLAGMVRPKIFYATQVSSQPPTIILICNQPKAFTPTYRRYLLSIFRDHLRFGEVPIKLYLQKRRQHDERDDMSSGKDDERALAAAEALEHDISHPDLVDHGDDSLPLDDDMGSLHGGDDLHDDAEDFHLHDEESGVR
jgi:GTP-binding protein